MMAMETLETLRDALAGIAGVASCKIGLEQNISPADYPLIRIVPSRLTPGRPYSRRTIETLIYFGMDTSEAEATGLQGVYSDLFGMESSIREVLTQDEGGRYLETITDEDRLNTYKLMAIRCEVTEQAMPAPPPPPAPAPSP